MRLSHKPIRHGLTRSFCGEYSRDPNMTFPRRNSMGAVSRPLPAQWGAGPRPGADLDGARSVIDEMSDEDAEETLPAVGPLIGEQGL